MSSSLSYLIYVFTPCCEGATIRLKPSSTHLPSGLVYNFDEGNDYTGPEIGLVPEKCYTLTHEFIEDGDLYNSLATTPYQQGSVILWSPPGDFPEGCNSLKCQDCANYPNLGTFTIQSCCDENYQETFHVYQYPQEDFPLAPGITFEYTGSVIPQGCYQIVRDGGVFTTAVYPFLELEDFIIQTSCETVICQSYCPQEICYTLVNCFEDITLHVQFTPDTQVNLGDVIAVNIPQENNVTLPNNNCWTVQPFPLPEEICFTISSEAFANSNSLLPTSYDQNDKPVYSYEISSFGDTFFIEIYWNNNRWEMYANSELFAFILNPDQPVSQNTVYAWETLIETITVDSNIGNCDCNLEIVKNVEVYTEITEDNVNAVWDVFESLFVANGLTQSDILGNYLSSNLSAHIPGSPQGLAVTGGTIPYTYFWEILNQSGTYSNVSIVDSSAFPLELIQTGPSAGDPFIRIKLTITDAENCETELIFFTGGFN